MPDSKSNAYLRSLVTIIGPSHGHRAIDARGRPTIHDKWLQQRSRSAFKSRRR